MLRIFADQRLPAPIDASRRSEPTVIGNSLHPAQAIIPPCNRSALPPPIAPLRARLVLRLRPPRPVPPHPTQRPGLKPEAGVFHVCGSSRSNASDPHGAPPHLPFRRCASASERLLRRRLAQPARAISTVVTDPCSLVPVPGHSIRRWGGILESSWISFLVFSASRPTSSTSPAR